MSKPKRIPRKEPIDPRTIKVSIISKIDKKEREDQIKQFKKNIRRAKIYKVD